MAADSSDILKFKVPIPSSFIRRNESVCVQNSEVSNSLQNGFFMPKPSCTPSLWSGSTGRREKPAPPRKVFYPPPPPAPIQGFYHTKNDETNVTNNFFYGNRLVHSTPQHHNVGIGMSSNSLQFVPDSMIYHSGWNGSSASAYRKGSESVRSFSSVNTDYVDKIFTKALNKYLEKNNVNPAVQDLAIQVANGLRSCAQEAVLELGPPDSSCRSVYSEKGSTWRSGVSVTSGRSQGQLHSLMKNGRHPQQNRRDPAISITCSGKETVTQSRRQHQTRTAEEKRKLNETSISVVEKSVLPTELEDHGEEDSSDDCVIPQTVRRNPTAATPVSPVVRVFGSPKIAKLMNEIAAEKKEKLKELESKKERQNESATPRRKKVVKTKKSKITEISTTEITKKKPAKRKNTEADISSVTTTISATATVQCTRSGRNVKKPSFYQVPQKNKTHSRRNSKVVQHQETTSIGIEISVTDQTHAVTYTKKIKETKPTNTLLTKQNSTPHPRAKALTKKKEAISSTVLETITENIVHTRSGRAIKPVKTFGEMVSIETPNESLKKGNHSQSSKENTPPKVKKATRAKKVLNSKVQNKGKPESVNEPMLVEEEADAANHLDFSDMSFGGAEFIIPQVAQSTRRAGVKGSVRGAVGTSLGAQTPPLFHLTAHLPENLVGSSTPNQQTPDWQISHRSQSELKEFRKRKVKKKNNIVKVASAKKKPSKALLKAMAILRAPLPASPMRPTYYDDSDESESSL